MPAQVLIAVEIILRESALCVCSIQTRGLPDDSIRQEPLHADQQVGHKK